MVFLAELFIGAGLAFFANIAGAVGLTATTYWLPYLFYMMLHRHTLPTWRIGWYTINMVIGLGITALGLYYNIKDLTESSTFEIFSESECKEGAEFFGSEMWDRNVNNQSQIYRTLVEGCCQDVSKCGDD